MPKREQCDSKDSQERCVQPKQWSDATIKWRPKKEGPHTIFPCHCKQDVDTCKCPRENSSPKLVYISYGEDTDFGVPCEKMNPDCMTHQQIVEEGIDRLENMQAHYGLPLEDQIPLDPRFEKEFCDAALTGEPVKFTEKEIADFQQILRPLLQPGAAGGAAGGAADSAAKADE